MGRGFFSGVFWASVVSIVGLGLLAQLVDMIGVLSEPDAPVAEQVQNAAPVVAETTAQTPAGSVAAPVAPPPVANDSAEVAEQAAQPKAGDAVAALQDPVTGNAPRPPAAPSAGGVAVTTTPLPGQPQADATPAVGRAPVLPNVSEPTEKLAASPATDSSAEAPVASSVVVAAGEPNAPKAPLSEAVPSVDFSNPQVVVVPTPSGETTLTTPSGEASNGAASPGSEAAVASGDMPQAITGPARETVPAATPAPAPVVKPEPVIVQETAPKDTPAETGQSAVVAGKGGTLLKPVTGIGNRAAGVQTNRLPSIGGPTPEAEAKPAEPEEAPEIPDAPAIEQFAADFENPEGRPLMAILLLSDQANGGAALPFPVSYVVDASKDNAADLMRSFRDEGNEVVALAPLPEGAAPVDVEVAFLTYLSAVPEAVAVMDVPGGEFQAGRTLASQVAQALAASGHGMITYSRGLNSAIQVAERDGVPAALVFREFDNKGQNGAAIKRFLDQAAFRAGQQAGVILVGHNRPETIKALLEWGLGNRASTVALAPVSAVLLAQ